MTARGCRSHCSCCPRSSARRVSPPTSRTRSARSRSPTSTAAARSATTGRRRGGVRADRLQPERRRGVVVSLGCETVQGRRWPPRSASAAGASSSPASRARRLARVREHGVEVGGAMLEVVAGESHARPALRDGRDRHRDVAREPAGRRVRQARARRRCGGRPERGRQRSSRRVHLVPAFTATAAPGASTVLSDAGRGAQQHVALAAAGAQVDRGVPGARRRAGRLRRVPGDRRRRSLAAARRARRRLRPRVGCDAATGCGSCCSPCWPASRPLPRRAARACSRSTASR